jgi:hypothetical protein
MNERDKELAKQAGARLDKHNGGFIDQSVLLRFATLIRADEREACAKVCDEHNARQNLFAEERYAAHWLASAIRARGNT